MGARDWRRAAARLGVTAMLGSAAASAQSASAVPKLDLNQLAGAWTVMAQYPVKAEKTCIGAHTVLFALGNKKGSFQMGSFCKLPGQVEYESNANGKMDKAGDGRLKLGFLWPFTRKYWVLATGPSYQWALTGTPNHKSLWVLSKTGTLDPTVYQEIVAKAAADGYKTDRLVQLPKP